MFYPRHYCTVQYIICLNLNTNSYNVYTVQYSLIVQFALLAWNRPIQCTIHRGGGTPCGLCYVFNKYEYAVDATIGLLW